MVVERSAEALREVDLGGGRRLRVLLLDAHDVVHWGFKMLLAAEHWVERFMAAHSPDEAVELARRFAPHVAVVDVGAAGGGPRGPHPRPPPGPPRPRGFLFCA